MKLPRERHQMKKISLFIAICIFGLSNPFAAMEYEAKAKALVPELRKLIQSPEIIAAVRKQNQENAKLTQDDINALDKRWMSKDASLISPIMQNLVSKLLQKFLLESKGLYGEIFVMDNRGLNVGQSGPTSDFWQGDEAKWKETFLVGPDAIHVSKIEYDESSKEFSFQLSFSIVDGNEVIGAVTFGVNGSEFKKNQG
jgi:hypothetical protein